MRRCVTKTRENVTESAMINGQQHVSVLMETLRLMVAALSVTCPMSRVTMDPTPGAEGSNKTAPGRRKGARPHHACPALSARTTRHHTAPGRPRTGTIIMELVILTLVMIGQATGGTAGALPMLGIGQIKDN